MTVVGEAFVELRPKSDAFRKELEDDVNKAVKGADTKVPLVGEMDRQRTSSNVFGAVKGIAAAVGGAFVLKEAFDFVKAGVDALGEIERIGAQTGAVIKSTGGAAGVSAKEVRDYADALEAATGIEAENVQEGQNLLLTFTNIKNGVGDGNDVFNQATKTLTDMSVALGTDVSGSAVQLGKALNDPVAGIAALSRVGVTFTDEQKNVIKSLVETGDVAGAQKVILEELNKEFGGSAEAFGNTGPGKMAKFRNALGGVQESLASGLIPVITTLAELFVTKVFPAMAGIADKVGPALSKAFYQVQLFVDALVNGFQGGSFFSDGDRMLELFHTVGGVIRETVLPALGTIVGFIRDNFEPILKGLVGVFILLTGPITAVVLTLGILYARFEIVREIVATVAEFFVSTFSKVKAFVDEVFPAIQEAIGHVMVVIGTIIRTTLEGIRTVWSVVGDDVLRIVSAVFSQIGNVIDVAVNTIANVIRLVLAVINGDWSKAWEAIRNIFSGVIDFVIGTVKNLGGILSGLFGAAFDLARRGIEAALPAILDFVGSIPGRIVDGLGNLGSLLLSAGVDMIEGFIRGIRNTAGKIVTAIKEAITDKLPGFVKDALGIRSPSRVFEALGSQVSAGFAAGISGAQGSIDSAMNRLVATPSIDPLILSAMGGAGAASGGARGPAVWIDKYEAREEADVDVLMRRAEFAVQSGTL